VDFSPSLLTSLKVNFLKESFIVPERNPVWPTTVPEAAKAKIGMVMPAPFGIGLQLWGVPIKLRI